MVTHRQLLITVDNLSAIQQLIFMPMQLTQTAYSIAVKHQQCIQWWSIPVASFHWSEVCPLSLSLSLSDFIKITHLYNKL